MDSNSEDTSGVPASCALCLSILTSENDASDIDSINMCSDCKFLLLEDLESPVRDVSGWRASGLRRTRYNSSSESSANLFSQQFSRMINLARQNQNNVLERDDHSVDGDASTSSWQQTSFRATPSGSRRWRRIFSDTESDGIDSVFADSESNVSFSGYRVTYGENETISYGGSSNASVDGSSLLGIENSADERSDHDTDIDIDPMRTGAYHWDSDDQEDDDNRSQEADSEENTINISILGGRSQQRPVGLFETTWGRLGTVELRIQERIQAQIPDFGNAEAQRLGELIENLAEAVGVRRGGAPPAAVSTVNNLPRVVIKDHEDLDSITCAICKDSLSAGTVAIQLPCSHLYHPFCILPWLSSRNTCPLCRYELPTDDQEYENRRQRSENEALIRRVQQNDMNENVPAENGQPRRDGSGTRTTRGRWLLLGFVGIALVFLLGNPMTEARSSRVIESFCSHWQPSNRSPQAQRVNRQGRRWWSLF